MGFNAEARASEHCFGRTAIGDEPVGRIARIPVLNKMQLRVVRALEHFPFFKVAITSEILRFAGAPLHALEQHLVPGCIFTDEVERQERVPQVVEHAHEYDDVEFFGQLGDFIDAHLVKFDFSAGLFEGELRLGQVAWIGIDATKANFLALNLMHDIVTGEKSVEEARDYYAKEFTDFRRGEPTPYMEKLHFSPAEGDAGDPDERIISAEELEQAQQEGKQH